MRSSGVAPAVAPLAAVAVLLLCVPSAATGPGTGRITGAVDPSLVDDPTSAVAYVEDVPGRSFTPPAQPAVMEQRGMQFIPHVLPVLRGTTVRFPNMDRVRHNAFSPSPAKRFNFGIYYPRDERRLTFDMLGTVTLLCNIHEQMSGYVIVLQNPYFARVTTDGRFEIEDVPDGRYQVVLWTERTRPRQWVTVRGGAVDASFGPATR
jgi:plastocyanin